MSRIEFRRRLLKHIAFTAAAFSTPGLLAEELTERPVRPRARFILITCRWTPTMIYCCSMIRRHRRLGGDALERPYPESLGAADSQCSRRNLASRHTGTYIHSRSRREQMDKNFQGFGRFLTSSTGEYYFRCIKPTEYVGRAPHIHYAILQNGQRMLTTQLYVKGDPRNEQDFLFTKPRPPRRKRR